MSEQRKTADTLERGDVIWWCGARWVVVEPSDSVSSAPLDQVFHGVSARDCCEPRIVELGHTGRVTHRGTYIIVPNKRRFLVRQYLDLDIRSAIPETI
jgi:hypothetical protein